MVESINDRIEQIVEEQFDGNKTAFAKSIGLPPTGMSSYLGKQRRSKPNIDMVTKIITTLHIDPLWLLTGEKSSQKNVQIEGSHNQLNEPGSHGNLNGIGDAVLLEKVKLLETLLSEKDERIAELKQHIAYLQAK